MDFSQPFNQFQKNIQKIFQKYTWPKPVVKNMCEETKFEFSVTQNFVSRYFTDFNPNGILLYHSVGSGKTLTAIKILSEFEKKNFNCLWITRTTLKKDLDKGLAMLPLKKKLPVFSYKQFSNICKRKGENYRLLMERARKLDKNTNDPFFRTVIIIDEAHKLYTKDLKVQELHDINIIQKVLFESYTNSDDRARVVLMSATPITQDPKEAIKLLNLVITKPSDRIPLETNYLDTTGKFTKEGKSYFQEKIKGLVSFIDISKDPGRFAQVKYTQILTPVSVVKENECNASYKKCLELGLGDCISTRKICKKRLADVKTQDQLSVLFKKCHIDLSGV